MLQQYLEIKEQHKDAILFYRMGDFYEMFFDDAVVAARELEITLTSRDKQAKNPIPMCGVPHHAADGYISQLLQKGYTVAICDQIGDPRQAKGLVRREVVRVVTPGTAMDHIDGKCANYLAALYWGGEVGGLAYLDLSTAEFRLTEISGLQKCIDELRRVEPRELLLAADSQVEREMWLDDASRCSVKVLPAEAFDVGRGKKLLIEQFQVHSLEGFGVENWPHAIRAAGAILSYVQRTQKKQAAHIKRLQPYRRQDYMVIDEVSSRHLELLRSWYGDGRQGSLLGLLDDTVTAMGGRLLRRWIRYPLLEPVKITRRQSAVSCFRLHEAVRSQLRREMEQIYDLERLYSRVAMGTATPRDLGALRRSLQTLPRVKHLLGYLQEDSIRELADRLDPVQDVAELLQQALVDAPPLTLTEGGIFRSGYHPELDQLTTLSRQAKNWIASMEAAERKKTGINSLKVGYNRVFGYYLEVSKANLALVPEHYIRKQTLANAERYVTEELKEYETQVLSADERRIRLEEELFRELRAGVAAQGERIQQSAAVIAELDVFAALAEVANRHNYCRPIVDDSVEISIVEGRHPTVEAALPKGEFVPNDIHLDHESHQVLIITGPNMAGKSTILRQVALIVLMAQMGCPVPASSAHLGVVDRIFTRVGASDELTRGRSTFMVEMQETAHILHQASERSLVILDEIGRGTSTFDGLSIAWAVAEFLHDWQGVGVKTLFATHYHELTELSATRPRVRNMTVAVKEWGDQVIFLRKLIDGGANRSYGIQVARLAGLPEEVVLRAKEILLHLERDSEEGHGLPRLARSYRGQRQQWLQLNLFQQGDQQLRRRLQSLDLERLTPLEALNELAQLRQLAMPETT